MKAIMTDDGRRGDIAITPTMPIRFSPAREIIISSLMADAGSADIFDKYSSGDANATFSVIGAAFQRTSARKLAP